MTFNAAYMTHTSTSPNYQILASLDIGRRQAELEGFELVQRQAYLAQSVAQMVARHSLLKKYFRVLTTLDLIPEEYRETRRPMPLRDGIAALDEAWRTDEFVMDPSRLTLHIGNTGVDGDTFKHKYLMDMHGIQVNKTSRNTVLFMTNIGTSRSAVAYLIDVLVKLAEHFERERADMSPRALAARDAKVAQMVAAPPPLPDFSRFADRYRSGPDTVDGDIRTAYFTTYKNESLRLHDAAGTVRAGARRGGNRLRRVRDALPAGIPDPGAGPGVHHGDPFLHGGARYPRDPRVRRGNGLPGHQRWSSRSPRSPMTRGRAAATATGRLRASHRGRPTAAPGLRACGRTTRTGQAACLHALLADRTQQHALQPAAPRVPTTSMRASCEMATGS